VILPLFFLLITQILEPIFKFSPCVPSLSNHGRAWLRNFNRWATNYSAEPEAWIWDRKKYFFRWGQPCCPWACRTL